LAAAARESPLVEKIVRIAASRVEELKDRDEQPTLGPSASHRKGAWQAAKIFTASWVGSESASDRVGN
jgi:hypothetical protein